MKVKQFVANSTLALVLLLVSCSISLAAVPPIERNALVAFYNATDGANWADNTNWLSGDPCENSWFGVTCNASNTTVEVIDMIMNNMNGSIPSELGNLSNLQTLDLYFNYLSGSIPSELGNLSNLQILDLRLNDFSGSIPPELGNLSSLQDLDLSDNHFSGSIPTELGNLSNLTRLYLDYNNLSGSIPTELGNLSNLESLWLFTNQLSGGIPTELGNLSNLKFLYLYFNHLSGSIPTELGNLSNLQIINLDNNEFIGSIPTEFGNLSNLQSLLFGRNHFSGRIPSELCNLTNLQNLGLSINCLGGSLPSELGNLTNLEYLGLGKNKLLGEIPIEFMNLQNLVDYGSCICRNALYTDNGALDAFLASKDMSGDWDHEQTIAPTDINATVISSTSILMSWDTIMFDEYAGGYKVYYSTNSGGPYTYFGITVDKTVSSMEVTDLDPDTNYYFVIQTVTYPNYFNQNTVRSEQSSEISAMTYVPTLGIISLILLLAGMSFVLALKKKSKWCK